MRLFPTRHPRRLTAEHPLLVEEFLDLAAAGRIEPLGQLIDVVADLTRYGRSSRYLTKLTGLPLFELKPRARGGQKGGCRIYLFFAVHVNEEVAGLVNCEVKDGATASTQKLAIALEVYLAAKQGVDVYQRAAL
ncbi:hypothetical protein [Gemmatimonas sp.]|uniref:hypothetical protein n=1 Tax=Gemmatimonas sp. TaxID=1962908 RepID=UPI0033402ECA